MKLDTTLFKMILYKSARALQILKWPESPSSVSRSVGSRSAPRRFVSSVLTLAFLSSPSLCCSSNLNTSVVLLYSIISCLFLPPAPDPLLPCLSSNTHSQLAKFLPFIFPILASLLLLETLQVRNSTLPPP